MENIQQFFNVFQTATGSGSPPQQQITEGLDHRESASGAQGGQVTAQITTSSEVIKINTSLLFVPPGLEVYDTTKDPRGHVYIFNFQEFVGRINMFRKGSEYDVQNLTSLFSQMGYVTNTYANLSSDDLFDELRDIQCDDILLTTSSFIMIFMSHGETRYTFKSSDWNDVSVLDIQSLFLADKCPALRDKPKIFFWVFCRGSYVDERLEIDVVRKDIGRESRNETVEIDTTKKEGPQDLAHIFSTPEGFASGRLGGKGTLFINSLCQVSAEYIVP